jgi:hypothetical protein
MTVLRLNVLSSIGHLKNFVLLYFCDPFNQVIKDCTDSLTADRVNVIVLSNHYSKSEVGCHKEKWYKTRYWREGNLFLLYCFLMSALLPCVFLFASAASKYGACVVVCLYLVSDSSNCGF